MSVAVLQPHDIPTLVALRKHFEAIRLAELTRLERKLAALSPEVRTRLDEITRLIVEKLLLMPTEQLESVGDGPMRVRYADALNRLFQLAAEDADKVEDSKTTVSTRSRTEGVSARSVAATQRRRAAFPSAVRGLPAKEALTRRDRCPSATNRWTPDAPLRTPRPTGPDPRGHAPRVPPVL